MAILLFSLKPPAIGWIKPKNQNKMNGFKPKYPMPFLIQFRTYKEGPPI
jgi:hypothetical protein